jgi:NAD(P)-dependent dehydrogenase (short-subunit alcohol dehydrogenase family)
MTPRIPISSPVVVTGCSSGIGRAVAFRLVRSGHPVYATARRVETLTELAAAGARVLALDVTDADARADVVKTVSAEAGPVGALVNNAGYGEYGPVEEVDLDAVRRQFETNVFGLIGLTQLVLPGMRERGSGRIVNISSMGGRMTLPGGGAYHASKYAVEAVTDALRFETRAFGIGVSLVEPGPVPTRFGEAATSVPDDHAGAYESFRRGVAARNAATYDRPDAPGSSTPEEVADVVARAVLSGRPRARYLVGATSRLMVWSHRTLPTPVWDAMLRRAYPSPRP